MRKIYSVLILFTFCWSMAVLAEVGAVPYLYTCKCCSKRFKGYMSRDLAEFTIEQNTGNADEDDGVPLKGKKYSYIINRSLSKRYDSDMCYIYAGVNKYNLAIVTCPYCGYSLSHRHFSELVPSDAIKKKVNKILKPRMERLRGMMDSMADRLDVVCQEIIKKQEHAPDNKQLDPHKRMVSGYDIQKLIPPYIKYRNAIECYSWINFSPTYISRVALNGSWAYRVQLCVPFTTNDPEFTRAYRSVHKRLEKRSEKLKAVKGRDPAVLLRGLLSGVASRGRISDMEKFIVYNMLVGLNDRLGRSREASQYLSEAKLLSHGNPRFEVYMKKKEKWLSFERYYQNISIDEKKKGFRENLCSRPEIFREMYILGELYKRTGRLNTAQSWFSTICEAEDLKSAALKHGAVERLKEVSDIVKTAGTDDMPGPDDAELLRNIRQGLGKVAYYTRKGMQKKGLSSKVCLYVLRKAGYAVMVFRDANGYYPESFEELWEHISIRERSEINYFCCPVSGKPYLYHPAKTGYVSWPLVCDPEPHLFKNKGRRYGVFRSNGKITMEKSVPGEIR